MESNKLSEVVANTHVMLRKKFPNLLFHISRSVDMNVIVCEAQSREGKLVPTFKVVDFRTFNEDTVGVEFQQEFGFTEIKHEANSQRDNVQSDIYSAFSRSFPNRKLVIYTKYDSRCKKSSCHMTTSMSDSTSTQEHIRVIGLHVQMDWHPIAHAPCVHKVHLIGMKDKEFLCETLPFTHLLARFISMAKQSAQST
jgi:hypothetical protein